MGKIDNITAKIKGIKYKPFLCRKLDTFDFEKLADGLHPNERRMYALFNEKELIIFEEDEDFVNWVIQLITK